MASVVDYRTCHGRRLVVRINSHGPCQGVLENPLHHVWAAGLRHRFPLIVLRLMLGAFAFARTLSYTGALSEKVHTLSAVLAEGGFAQVALFLVLVDPLDLIQATCTIGVTLCLYVDDIAAHVIGSPEMVSHILAACTDDLIHTLEDELDMVVSRRQPWSTSAKAKTVVAVSHGRPSTSA